MGWGKRFQKGEGSRGAVPAPCAGTGASKGTTSSIKGVRKGETAGRLVGSTEDSFVHRSQRCSVPALSGQMAGQHLLIRQEADKKYDLSLSQRGFSSSFFFQPAECVQSIISAWY